LDEHRSKSQLAREKVDELKQETKKEGVRGAMDSVRGQTARLAGEEEEEEEEEEEDDAVSTGQNSSSGDLFAMSNGHANGLAKKSSMSSIPELNTSTTTTTTNNSRSRSPRRSSSFRRSFIPRLLTRSRSPPRVPSPSKIPRPVLTPTSSILSQATTTTSASHAVVAGASAPITPTVNGSLESLGVENANGLDSRGK